MKKRTVIIIVICVLAAAVIALSVLGNIEPKNADPSSFTATYSKVVPTVTPDSTSPSGGTAWDNSEPTTP